MKGDGKKRRFASKAAAFDANREEPGFQDEQQPQLIRRPLPAEDELPEPLQQLLGKEISDEVIFNTPMLAYNLDVDYTPQMTYTDLCKRIYVLGFLTVAQSYLEKNQIGIGCLEMEPNVEKERFGECKVRMVDTRLNFKELDLGYPLKIEATDGTSVCTVRLKRSMTKKIGEFTFVCSEKETELEKYHKERLRFFEMPGTFMGRSIMRTADDLCQKQLQNLVFPRSLDPRDCTAEEYCRLALKLINKWGTFEELNVEQKLAVFSIVNRMHGDRPFVLFGPPGTGKTVTIIAAAARLLKANPNNRLLMCAPSGVASDRLALKLLELDVIPRDEILRLYSLSKDTSKRDKSLDCISILSDNEANYDLPETYEPYRVVICTIACTTHIINAGISDHFFSHVFIDECGQASEAEFFIPFGLCTPDTALILSGDAKQLGPVVSMDLTAYGAVFASPLLRYVNHPAYMDERLCVLLTESYRCHPAIIGFSSRTFYNGAVFSSPTIASRPAIDEWEYLPNKDFPVVFIDSLYSNETAMGTSFFNDEEVGIVHQLAADLIGKKLATAEELAVEKLNDKLKAISVIADSVERFQGSERRVVLISLTRTTSLGFVRSRRRMNTTLTRAQSLMVVVGKRGLLEHTPSYWTDFIRYCDQANSCFTFAGGKYIPVR